MSSAGLEWHEMVKWLDIDVQRSSQTAGCAGCDLLAVRYTKSNLVDPQVLYATLFLFRQLLSEFDARYIFAGIISKTFWREYREF